MARERLGIKKNELKEDTPKKVELAGKSLVIILHKGNVYALDSVCTHEGGPLEDGTIEGDEIVCPWHQGKYYLNNGKADHETNWVHDTKTYKIVEGQGNELFAEIQ